MGQIVIDIPSKATRRYNVGKTDDERQLMKVLDALQGVERNKKRLTRQEMQDIRDGIQADRVVAEMQRTGETYSVEQLRKEFGL